jgi:NodT family efflux transporter outer membrane factor (OMF) lipoprotein
MNDTIRSGDRFLQYLCTLLTIIAAMAAGAGCGVRRPYQPPVPNAPAAWSAPVTESADAESLSRWWETFGDDQLTALVGRAVEDNLDVRTAMSRVREARATTRSTRTQLWPSADVGGSARATGTGNEAGVAGVTGLYTLSIDASWEIDAFGGIRSTIDAASATADARHADLQDVLTTLTADVALNYIDIRSLQRRLEIARLNVDLQQETLELTQFRAQAGLATDLDVQQALSNVESTRAQIASLESQAGQSIHAIAILLGRPPAELNAEFTAPAPIPEAPIEATLGVPADALRRRPDVRSAERQLAAQFSQVNAARADLYPSFRLAGSIGLESLSLATLHVPGAQFWNIGPSASTRLFDRRQLRENLVVQSERQEQAARSYETVVLRALQEVEDSLTALAQEQVRRGHLAAAANAAQQAADLSLQLYNSGLRDFRDVLDAQRSLLTLQDSLASSDTTVSSDLVRLFKALGGGWSATEMLPESVATTP